MLVSGLYGIIPFFADRFPGGGTARPKTGRGTDTADWNGNGGQRNLRKQVQISHIYESCLPGRGLWPPYWAMDSLPTDDEVRAAARRLRAGLAAPGLREAVAAYFCEPEFAGLTFSDLGRNPPNEVTTDDLLAVSLLDIVWRPEVVRLLLGRLGPQVSAMLADIPQDTDLWDADDDVLVQWYVERFLALRETAFRDPKSYFHRYSQLSDAEATATATSIWERINLVNLHENILPTRQRSDLILTKQKNHTVQQVALRKL